MLNGDGFEKEKVASTENMVAGDPYAMNHERVLMYVTTAQLGGRVRRVL